MLVCIVFSLRKLQLFAVIADKIYRHKIIRQQTNAADSRTTECNYYKNTAIKVAPESYTLSIAIIIVRI